MTERELERYTQKIYAYCVKRIWNLADAEDLAQEIMLEALRGMQKQENIRNFEAWLWRVAHNRYARAVRTAVQARLYLENAEEEPSVPGEIGDGLEHWEATQGIFCALHRLAESHRKILVGYYVRGLSCAQMAERYALPLNTVKTRLHFGREKLKERYETSMEQKNIYEKLHWYLSGNGDVDPWRYCERQISRAILHCCYRRGLTLEDIANQTGIPCLYLEDELPGLLEGEVLTKAGTRFETNIVIHTEAAMQAAVAQMQNNAPALTQQLQHFLADKDTAIREIGIFGNDLPKIQLWHVLVPLFLRAACEESRRRHKLTERPVFPLRRDGGEGWIFAIEGMENQPEAGFFSGCNGYYRRDSKFTYYWTGAAYSEGLNRYLLMLEDVLGDRGALEDLSELQLAEGLSYGIFRKRGSGFCWNIPVFTKGQKEQLEEMKLAFAAETADNLLPVIECLYSLLLADTPKRLHSQLPGIFGATLNRIIAMVLAELEATGNLSPVQPQTAYRQVFLTVVRC